METNSEVIVYWAPFTLPDRQTLINLAVSPPVPLRKILPDGSLSSGFSYRHCTSAIDMWSNTYAFLYPQDSSVKVTGPLEDPKLITQDGRWIIQLHGGLDGYRVDYDYSWVFFCEEDLIIQQTPPYMHNTSDKEGGRVAAGAFNIGRWLRAITTSYLFWPNKDTITVTKDEPMFYVRFETEKKVILKQFELTPEIFSICHQTVAHKESFHFEPLSKLYDRFTRSNRHKLMLKLIKENLLD